MKARKETNMSKKHFIQLANTIIANRDAFPDSTISKLADFCKTQNPELQP
jgi:DNA-binding MurR/RpiR family transcriptional regulator